MSLTVPHFRSDGLGVFLALGSRSSACEPRGLPAASLLGTDLGDALTQVVRAVTGSVGLTVRLLADRDERTRIMTAVRGDARPSRGSSASEPRFFETVILDLDAASWDGRAQAHGGTTNSLFAEIAANLIRARGATGRAGIDVGIPMSLRRSEADARANALVVVPLKLPAGEPRHGDLRSTREATKTLLEGSGEKSAALVPEPLWHLLPGRYADRLKAPGAQQTDVVASNFGAVPDSVAEFAGQKAHGVSVRTMNVPGLMPHKARLRASLLLLRVADRLTLTVTAMPDQFGDAESLHRLVVDELTAWGLRARRWCGE